MFDEQGLLKTWANWAQDFVLNWSLVSFLTHSYERQWRNGEYWPLPCEDSFGLPSWILLGSSQALEPPRTLPPLAMWGSGVHYRLFSVWTLVPVRLDQQLADHSTVDEIASGAADCRLTYTMANCPQRRKGKRKREREKEGKRARKRQGLVVLGSGEENPRVLLGDADQESETRMSKNALRTGRRQAVE
ncbi:hypothetical protein TNCV_4871331 [Trichonephila clavipes]|nr:hypothetical protein TNCV_4871331 [Trichonephila clavipes]